MSEVSKVVKCEVPEEVVCPLCKKDTPLFLHQPKSDEVLLSMPDLSGRRLIATSMEIDAIRVLRETYLCLACGISFRRIFEYEVGKANAKIEQQQPGGRT